MNERNRKTAVAMLALAMTAGCSANPAAKEKDKAPGEESNTNKAPVVLKVYPHFQDISEGEFNQLIAAPVKLKFPHITLELIPPSRDVSLSQMIVNGEFADLVYTGQKRLQELADVSIPLNLNELIKKNGVDLGKFNPAAVEAVQLHSGSGKFLAIPLWMNYSALFYNKDIFDRFATAYPKDGNTWEDMIALSRQLAKSENGVSYQPLDPGGIVQMASPLSLPAVDPVSKKPVFTTGGWYTVFDVFSRLVEVSGVRDNFQGGPKGTTAFTKDRTMAMVARPLSDMVGPLSQLKEQKIDFNWDMVTYPAYLQAPGKSMGIDIANLVVSSMSKKREEAFAVAAYLTTSEMQTLAARSGRQTALKETAVQQQFGTNVEALKGKNMKALSTVPAGDVVLDKLENLARAELNKARNETI